MKIGYFASIALLIFMSPLSIANNNIYKDISDPNRSPEDEFIYFVLLDRFANGNPDNDNAYIKGSRSEHGFDPSNEDYYHGGDLQGLSEHLDYLENLGVTALWLSPVFKNHTIRVNSDLVESASYHGYWVEDYLNVDPHLGTNDELKSLIENAHARGIKIYLDLVLNHTFDAIKFRECHDEQGAFANPPFVINHGNTQVNYYDCTYRGPDSAHPYTPFLPEPYKSIKHPAWLNDISNYHNYGDTNHAGESALLGDFNGGDDLNTSKPEVINGLIDITKFWMKNFNIDGFRVDTVKNIEIEFWQTWNNEIQSYAKQLGKPNFFIFGEAFDYSAAGRSKYLKAGHFPSLLDFGIQGTIRSVFSKHESPEQLDSLFLNDDFYITPNTQTNTLANFIGNHDIGRFAYFVGLENKGISAQEQLKRVEVANAFMFFARGIPTLYYGDEQGFVGTGPDKESRVDMFKTKTQSYATTPLLGTNKTAADSNFDYNHPLFKSIRAYAQLYKNEPALRRGAMYPLYHDSDGPGIYAFSRVLKQESIDYLIVFNSATTEKQVSLPVSRPSYQLLLTNSKLNEAMKPDQNGKLNLHLPGLSFAVYKAEQTVPSAPNTATVKFDTPIKTEVLSGQVQLKVSLDGLTTPLQSSAVRFYVNTGDGFHFIGTDTAPPYRLFWDASHTNNGAQVTFKAIAELNNREIEVSTSNLVDSRLPSPITLYYQNGNARDSLFIIDDHGQLATEKANAKQGAHYVWHDNVKTIGLFPATRNHHQFRFDRPIFINRSQLLQYSTEDPDGSLKATLFIDNNGDISQHKQTSNNKPQRLKFSADPTSQFTDLTFFLRGSMNGWGLADEMINQGNGQYSVSKMLDKGTIEFKFADQSWTKMNVGLPFAEQGLSNSEVSENIFSSIDKRQLYNFYYFAYDDIKFHLLLPDPGPFGQTIQLYSDLWHDQGAKSLRYMGDNFYQLNFSTLKPGLYQMGEHSNPLSSEHSSTIQLKPNVRTPINNFQSLVLDIPAAANYSIRFNYQNGGPTIAVMTQQNKSIDYGPLNKNVFVRGSMNAWETTIPLNYGGDLIYRGLLFLKQGNYEFKVSDNNWSTAVNIGTQPTGNHTLQLAQEKTLYNGSDSENIKTQIKQTGTYNFTLNASNPSLPTLVIEESNKFIIHYYLPNKQQWDIQILDSGDNTQGSEIWYIDQLQQYFETQEEAMTALNNIH